MDNSSDYCDIEQIRFHNGSNCDQVLSQENKSQTTSRPEKKSTDEQEYQDQLYHSICKEIEMKRGDIQKVTNQPFLKSNTAEDQKKSEFQNSLCVIRKGYLQKKSSSFLDGWEKRYCIITRQKLILYQDQNRHRLISSISFKNYTCSLVQQRQDLTIQLFIEQFSDKIYLRTNSEKDMEELYLALKATIDLNSISRKIKFKNMISHIYKEKDTVLESEFINAAETGDIVLMKTRDSQCALQRFVTNSQYDHVGLVMKFVNNQVKIFQANPDEGVNVYDWSFYNTQFNHYEKICFRKLYYSQKQKLHREMMQFIKENIGKKYDFSAMKLFRKSSQTAQTQVEDNRGYFCSELVAKAYKATGLLDKSKASTRYWPFDFTERSGIVLNQQACFGSERLIILNKHLKNPI